MQKDRDKALSEEIVRKAIELGADLAGIADVAVLMRSPSHAIFGKLKDYNGVGSVQTCKEKPDAVLWPEGFRSAIVIALSHPETCPELDWWKDGLSGGTSGNKKLMAVNAALAGWLDNSKGIKVRKLPYHIENGGIFLKDAAVMAGLGCIGRNNMLVTPGFGPRVRLRAMLTEVELPATGPVDFDPCAPCSGQCRQECPRHAFAEALFGAEEYGRKELPGRDGRYDRLRCNQTMVLNEAEAEPVEIAGRETPGRLVRYCRLCEFSCPVGKTDRRP